MLLACWPVRKDPVCHGPYLFVVGNETVAREIIKEVLIVIKLQRTSSVS